jgi:hypothetical protein
LKKKCRSVIYVQEGVPCEKLSTKAYKGCIDAPINIQPFHGHPQKGSENYNHGKEPFLQTGHYATTYRSVIRFDLQAIPKDVSIHEALIQINLYRRPGRHPSEKDIVAYQILKKWTEDQVCWKGPNSSIHWIQMGCSEPGKDRSEKPIGKGLMIEEKHGWISIRLDPNVIQKWIKDPASNHGILIKDEYEKNGSWCHYRSREYYDPGMRPRLILGY